MCLSRPYACRNGVRVTYLWMSRRTFMPSMMHAWCPCLGCCVAKHIIWWTHTNVLAKCWQTLSAGLMDMRTCVHTQTWGFSHIFTSMRSYQSLKNLVANLSENWNYIWIHLWLHRKYKQFRRNCEACCNIMCTKTCASMCKHTRHSNRVSDARTSKTHHLILSCCKHRARQLVQFRRQEVNRKHAQG